MSRWFRHYAGMMRDDKLVRVALQSGQTIERVVWVYGAILESAAEINDGGKYDFDAAEAAHFLHADLGDISAIEASLADCGRISEGCVTKWGNRQFTSDDSNERVRRHREKQKIASNGKDIERQEKPVRYRNKNVTLRNAPETDTEAETEKKDISVAHATLVNIAIGPIAFESFWKTYPKREGSNPKEPARKRFMAIIKAGADPDAVIASARAYANEMRENKQFGTPYVAQAITWLNQQRWKDYTPAPDDPDKPRDDEVLAKHGYQWDETQGKVVKIEAA